MRLKKNQFLILIITLIFTFLLVYSPHFENPFPIHIDEWHHITEAIKLKQGNFQKGLAASKSGFHFFLVIISFFDSLVLIYKFLPAIFAVISAIVLFFIVRSKTSHLESGFLIALFSIIFFASIKSNANLTGLWFFTPLTFSIPFIFIYIFLFSEGIIRQNNKLILLSLIIMLFLIPIHAISVLFSIPILIIFSLFHLQYLKREYRLFLIFLLIPLIGIIFYSWSLNLTFINSIKDLIARLTFKHGWGVLETENSFFEIYSLTGYILAIIGIIYIAASKNRLKENLIYILWPVVLLISIFIFRLNGISFLSPYQRNLYYFSISLPFLSSLGVYSILKIIKIQFNNKFNSEKNKIIKVISVLLVLIILFFTFKSYFSIQENIELYKTIDTKNYEAIKFLSSFEFGRVISTPEISEAIFPISGHEPIATIYFYGNRTILDNFFNINSDCEIKKRIIKDNNVSYVLTENPINCDWEIIYNKNNNFIYKV